MRDEDVERVEAGLRATARRRDDGADRRVWGRVMAHQEAVAPARARRWVPAMAVVGVPAAAAVAIVAALALSQKPAPPPLAGAQTPRTDSTPATIHPSATPSPPALTQLRMVTEKVGWALECCDATPYRLVRTIDGGRHWRPALDAGQEVRAWVFAARGPSEAWAVADGPAQPTGTASGLAVLHTIDRGGTSASSLVSDPPESHLGITFLESTHGWLYGGTGSGTPGGSAAAKILRTVDGGVTWQKVAVSSQDPSPGAAARLPGSCDGHLPGGPPAFGGALDGLLTGGLCAGKLDVYVTDDGGSSWRTVYLPPFPGAPYKFQPVIYDEALPPSGSPASGRLLVRRGFTTGANALSDAALYSTVDGGRTWRAVRLPAACLYLSWWDPVQAVMLGGGDGGDFTQVSLYATHDGGVTWAKTIGPLDLNQPGAPSFLILPDSLQFVNETVGFVVPGPGEGTGKLFETTDGGRTWTEVPAALP